MITRIVLLTLDGFGIGALPDADAYGDGGCNTLQRLAAISKGLVLPNLEQLGLGHLGQFQGIRPMVQPEGCFGMLGFATKGKNSLTGHWELAGYVIEADGPHCETFTPELTTALEAALAQKTLGNASCQDCSPINGSFSMGCEKRRRKWTPDEATTYGQAPWAMRLPLARLRNGCL